MKQYRITTVSDLGQVVRTVRKASGVRQDDLAGSAGVSHVYMRDLEHGKETAQIGRAMQVLSELGIAITLEIPDEVFERIEREKQRDQNERLGRGAVDLTSSRTSSTLSRKVKDK